MKRVVAIGGAVLLAGAALYVAGMAATLTVWASLWTVSGWAR